MPAAAQKPDLPPEAIHRWLHENYSIEGRLESLPGERDLNFLLETAGGDRYVCKFCGAADDLDLLSAQNEVLTLLAKRDLAAIPEILTSTSAEDIVPLHHNGRDYMGRVLTFVPGQILAECAPYSGPLLRDLGSTMGHLNSALSGFDHPAFHYTFDWDLAQSIEVVERYRDLIPDPRLRDAVDQIHRGFVDIVAPRFDALPKSVIHNDANDYNVLAEGDTVTGIIDFGDMVHSYTICDLAIATAYASLGSDDVLGAVKEMAIGYHAAMPIGEDELAVLLPMVRMRLAVSACMAAHQMRLRPDDPYLSVSQKPIRETLPKLLALDAKEVHRLLEKALA